MHKAEIGKDINKAIDLLMADEVVAIPTETVYGLAGNALSEKAIQRIFEIKNRPLSDPLIVHLPDIESISIYVKDIPELACQLFEAFSPGPLTILLPKSNLIPDLVTNRSEWVAIRIPNHPITLKLLKELPFPLVAPSANPFGKLSPTLPTHVEASLGKKIKYILDGGPCQVGVESTIVKISSDHRLQILRQGGLTEETLLTFANLLKEESEEKPIVPGSMMSHYAPNKKLFIGKPESMLSQFQPKEIGFIGFDSYSEFLPKENQKLLSETGNLEEAARKLFSVLHEFDQKPFSILVATPFPNLGIGKAINDRLKRAASKKYD